MDPTNGQVTPTHGALGPAEHNAFLLRVLMHLVASSEGGKLSVDLNDVLESTKDKTMMVGLVGSTFTAQVHDVPTRKH